MAKLTLINLTNLQNETSAVTDINANSDAIETAIENTLSRDGTTPNAMDADLDMNSNQILNLPVPGTSTSPVRLQDLVDAALVPSIITGILYKDQEDQIISGGADVTSKSLVTGNVTIDCGDRPLQYITNNGAFTITAPTEDGSCILLVTNGAAAGSITFTGFSVGSSTGDTLTTVNTSKFSISIWRINGVSGYRIAAHQ
jgi:hypothetical protein